MPPSDICITRTAQANAAALISSATVQMQSQLHPILELPDFLSLWDVIMETVLIT